ncbi:MAG TPA: 2-hydroxyacid dehydrogenase [Ignavibacteria bacterium]|nr:2-hydroxyacid dehydrogenase [Ignavibacteria bacterium]HMQ97882.1 2-hydroxyacid dehydrogenase [Ignavibacteria bacterium]
MKILFLSRLSEDWNALLNKLKEEFPEVEFRINDNPEKRISELESTDAVIAGRLTAEEIESAEKLKAVIVPFTGLNNFPLDIINKKNIKLYNTHANAPFVAEHAVALALALLGKVSEFQDDLKKGKWNRTKEADDMWTSIRRKNIGILGYGHIGKYIAKYLKAFDCFIIGFKRNLDLDNNDLADEISNNIDEVIAKSDVIFNVLPLNPETKHIINAEKIAKMKGKYIITVGRGETIQEEAMYNGLKDGTLAGAAIDVWYKYPGKSEDPVMPANFSFWELPNVIMSPHKSAHTAQAVKAMIEDTCVNIRKFIISQR